MTIILRAIADDGQHYLVADRLLGKNTDLQLAPYPKIIAHYTKGTFVALSAWAGYTLTRTTRFKDELVRLSLAGHHNRVQPRLRKAAKRVGSVLHMMVVNDHLCHKYYSDGSIDQDVIGYSTPGGVNHLLRSLNEVVFDIWVYHLQCGFTEAPSVVNCADGVVHFSPWEVLTSEQQAAIRALSAYLDGECSFTLK